VVISAAQLMIVLDATTVNVDLRPFTPVDVLKLAVLA
jgi:hypothetical protein